MHLCGSNTQLQIAIIPEELLVDPLTFVERCMYAKSVDLLRHSQVTAVIAKHLAEHSGIDFGFTPRQAYIAGFIHDVGKVYVPDAILEKKEAISQREWEVIQRHPVWGREFIAGTVLETYGAIILHHHEIPDGTGYPSQLSSDAIPLSARLISFSDRLAAFLEDRPYRRRILHFGLMCKDVRANAKILFCPEDAKHIVDAALDFISTWIGTVDHPMTGGSDKTTFKYSRGECQLGNNENHRGCGMGHCLQAPPDPVGASDSYLLHEKAAKSV